METPASLDNGTAAAICIQRAFRGMQQRIAVDEGDLAAALNTLEEADEARINARHPFMATVNKAIKRFMGNVGLSVRGGLSSSSGSSGGGGAPKAVRPDATSVSQRVVLPSLSVGSIHNLVAGLGKNERVSMLDTIAILKAAAVMFMNGTSVCDIEVPEGGKCVVVGDLHGQLVGEHERA
jgi:serine/threonine-protein phosphatase with EF-hand domain